MGDNSTSTCGYNVYIEYAGISICVIVICISALTIVTICRTRELHTNQYIFIVSLAVADILMSLCFLTRASIRLIADDRHIFYNLVYGMMFSSVVLDMLHMSIIAVDRYIRIAYPFYYIQNMTKQRIIKILSGTYIFCFINACIPIVLYQDTIFKDCSNMHEPVEYYFSNISILAVNIFVVFLCYSKIAWIAIRHKKATLSRRQRTGDIINRSNRVMFMKSVRFFVAMFGVFFTLSLPPFVITNLAIFNSVDDVIKILVSHCFPLHSALNFIICCSMNQSFFKALNKVFVDLKTQFFMALYPEQL